MLDEMAEGESTEILGAVVKAAKGGDIRAPEIVLSRVWPIRWGRQVALDLLPFRTASDLLTAIGRVVDAVNAGELTTEEGQALSAVLEVKRRTIETIELEARLAALERERDKWAAPVSSGV
jgi:hypothetical protein